MNEPQLMMFEQINNNSGTELWTVKRPNFCQIGVLASETGCFKCASQGSCLLGPWGPADGSEHTDPVGTGRRPQLGRLTRDSPLLILLVIIK